MDMPGWSNGCESGWTVYLDESNYIPRNEYASHSYTINSARNDTTDEEDLSMVSDASSGPTHLQDEEECYTRNSRQNFYTKSAKSSKKSEKRSKKSAVKEHKLNNDLQNQHSYTNNHLDDTASSPALSYTQMYANPSCDHESVGHYMGFSQPISATHYQENSSYNNHYSYWQSSLPNGVHSVEPSHLTGRRWD